MIQFFLLAVFIYFFVKVAMKHQLGKSFEEGHKIGFERGVRETEVKLTMKGKK